MAKELVASQPKIVITVGTPATLAVQRETRTIPIVFLIVADPVGAGIVDNLARPGGNTTGFGNPEGTFGGKLLSLLKRIAPGMRRAAAMFNPDTAPGRGLYYLGSFEAAARSLAIEPLTAEVRSDADIGRVITMLGQEQAGLVLLPDNFMFAHRRTVIGCFNGHNESQHGVVPSLGGAMRRRDFIKVIASAVASWPLAARAQLGERMRRIGAMMLLAEDDPQQKAWTESFLRGLQEAGWNDRRNMQIDYRWGGGDSARARRYAGELVALAPDVILAPGSASLGPLLQATRDIPIVFVHVPDPVGAGFVDSLAKPGGNATGFLLFEYGISTKWVELLKQIAPAVTRVAVIRDPAITAGIGQWSAIQAMAPLVGMEVVPVNVRDSSEIERTVAAFARASNGGLIVTGSALATTHRDLIIALANQHKLPAVYYEHLFVHRGGLISYGPDLADQYWRSAGYVDRILKGAKPADLPVQAPTRFQLAVNVKTAKALGLDVPPTLLARADEVIE
jgi:ABC-type uncharacterized transport system substrate-binding protein